MSMQKQRILHLVKAGVEIKRKEGVKTFIKKLLSFILHKMKIVILPYALFRIKFNRDCLEPLIVDKFFS